MSTAETAAKPDTTLFKAPCAETFGANKASATLVEILSAAKQDENLPRTDQPVGQFKYGFSNALAALGILMANQIAKTGKTSPAAHEAAELANSVADGAVPSQKTATASEKDTTPNMGA